MCKYDVKIETKPLWNNTNTIIAAIEEISMMPMGGMIFLNGSKKVHKFYQEIPHFWFSNAWNPRREEINNHSYIINLNQK